MMSQFDVELDTSGLRCPLPLLRAKKVLCSMQTGETLRITSTDPSSISDFKSFCQQTDHQLLESETQKNKYYILLKKR